MSKTKLTNPVVKEKIDASSTDQAESEELKEKIDATSKDKIESNNSDITSSEENKADDEKIIATEDTLKNQKLEFRIKQMDQILRSKLSNPKIPNHINNSPSLEHFPEIYRNKIKLFKLYVANILVDHKANRDTADNLEKIKKLIVKNPDLKQYFFTAHIDEQNNDALHLAIEQKFTGLILLLCRYRANPDSARFDQKTPLHIAVSKRDLDSVKILLVNGANTTIKDDDGKTPLDIASDIAKIEASSSEYTSGKVAGAIMSILNVFTPELTKSVTKLTFNRRRAIISSVIITGTLVSCAAWVLGGGVVPAISTTAQSILATIGSFTISATIGIASKLIKDLVSDMKKAKVKKEITSEVNEELKQESLILPLVNVDTNKNKNKKYELTEIRIEKADKEEEEIPKQPENKKPIISFVDRVKSNSNTNNIAKFDEEYTPKIEEIPTNPPPTSQVDKHILRKNAQIFNDNTPC